MLLAFMEPVTRFPILELPTELVLLILSYAAQPTFFQTERCDAENPYSSALALSRVSRLFRRAVLPKMLHTVSLSPFHSLRNFERALRMQKAYAQQNHHLHFEYAPHVHRIWLGNSLGSEFVIGLDFSLLAEVLLAAESLAINFECLSFLVPRLDLAWDSHMAKNIDHTRSPLPRSTKTLTIWEDEDNFLDRHIIKGSPFIASISHLISLSHPAYTSRHVPGRNDGDLGSGDYKLPKWMAHAPWDCFTSLQTVSVALPLIICQAPLPL
ncbi:hypothetical protein DFH29DRAFT_1085586, partial [Suillus ampliporus]